MRRREWNLQDIAQALPAKPSKKGKKQPPPLPPVQPNAPQITPPPAAPWPPQVTQGSATSPRRTPTPPSVQPTSGQAASLSLPRWSYGEEQPSWGEESYQQKYTPFKKPSQTFGTIDPMEEKYMGPLQTGRWPEREQSQQEWTGPAAPAGTLHQAYNLQGQGYSQQASYSQMGSAFQMQLQAGYATGVTAPLGTYQQVSAPQQLPGYSFQFTPGTTTYAPQGGEDEVSALVKPLPSLTPGPVPYLQIPRGDVLPLIEQNGDKLRKLCDDVNRVREEIRVSLLSMANIDPRYRQALEQQKQSLDRKRLSRNPEKIVNYLALNLREIDHLYQRADERHYKQVGKLKQMLLHIANMEMLLIEYLCIQENVGRVQNAFGLT